MKSKRSMPRIVFGLILLLLCVVIVGGVGLAWIYIDLTMDLPNLETLRKYHPCLVSRVYDANGEAIGEFFLEKREIVSLDKVPKVLIDAIIAAEDANFYNHEGLDLGGILRALVKNVLAGEIVQGGSTITQQVVKALLLSPERSYTRKLKEAVLAYRLERSLSKDEILLLYLNQIYFGHGAYGIQVASQNYFGRDVSEVDLAEAALLAGLPQAPSRYSPATHPERARERQRYVLEQMLAQGMITRKDMESALAEKVSVRPAEEINPRVGPYFVDYVREYLLERYGKEQTFCGGLRIYTTLLKEEQEVAEKALAFGVKEFKSRKGKAAAAAESVEGALVSMDLPSGSVRAMVGGTDYSGSQFNRAIQAKRQPGSAIKPIIYAAALDKGYTPASIVVDSPIVFQDPVLEGRWKPRNYSREFVGPTTLREAFMNSRNVVTIKVLKDIGVEYAIRYARKMGMKSALTRDLSFALGSSETTLLELVSTYSAFACQGNRSEPLLILKVVTAEGKVLEENEPRVEQAVSPQIAYLMTSMMQSVVQEGTGKAAKGLGVPCAGKTGTTNDFHDAWFVGYTTEKIAGVWMGYDRPRNLGFRETGGRMAAPVWLYFMKHVLKGKGGKPFPVPPGIVFANVDTRTGMLATKESANTRLECFIEGTEPTQYSEEEHAEEFDFFVDDMGSSTRGGKDR